MLSRTMSPNETKVFQNTSQNTKKQSQSVSEHTTKIPKNTEAIQKETKNPKDTPPKYQTK